MAVIGIMDSGLGGFSVLREIVKVLPNEKYIYFADNAFCPYGEKTQEFIIGRCREITDFFISEGASAIVIACNTATAAAIADLRAIHPELPFVGMEPAVKPAALGTKSGVIGVLATAGTLKASKYLNTKERFEDDVTIVEHIGQGFVELVESGLMDGHEAEATVRASLLPLLEAGADRIVLGCTHYPFLLPLLERENARYQSGLPAGKRFEVRFIDPAPAVTRQLVKVLEEHGIGTEGHQEISLNSSGSPITDRLLNIQ